MTMAGGATASSSSLLSAPSISTSASLTILTTCWPGVTERSTSWPTARLGDRVDEVARYRKGDVGLEQGDPDFAHGAAHVVLGEGAAAAKLVEHAAKAVAQGLEHALNSGIDGRKTVTRRRAKPRRPAYPVRRSSMCVTVKTWRRLAEGGQKCNQHPCPAASRDQAAASSALSRLA